MAAATFHLNRNIQIAIRAVGATRSTPKNPESHYERFR